MRKISFLEVDDQKVFNDIASAKQQPRKKYLQDARALVFAAYQDYEDLAPEVGNLPNLVLTANQHNSLIHAFEVKTLPMAQLRGRLLNQVSVARCPFCGISESATLDHYLPKELNPQFSIFPKNLIPCCPICNTRKRDKVLDENNDIRLFLHPYFDNIPQALFIKVDISLMPDAINLRYGLVRPAGVTLRIFRHLQSHFRLLGLADRYRLMALEHLRAQYRSLLRLYGDNEDDQRVATSLLEKATDFEEVYGPNYWLTVLYHTLAVNQQFCAGGFEVLKRIQ